MTAPEDGMGTAPEGRRADAYDWSESDVASLASRISALQESENVEQRLMSMDYAWVLVFDADTEDEAVYSMEVDEDGGSHVVLAFEDKTEAERYASSLKEETGGSSDASVQALDVEALVVTSRDADFRVGIVFRGDLTTYTTTSAAADAREAALDDGAVTDDDSDFPATPAELARRLGMSSADLASFLASPDEAAAEGAAAEGAAAEDAAVDDEKDGGVRWSPLPSASASASDTPPRERVSVSITMVPDSCFEGKSASDFLDPSEDPVWVLVHDAGTADAQYFSMTVNGTSSVVCFKDEAAAQRCGEALQSKGAIWPSPRSLFLEDLIETLGDDDVEVCLVDEVIEHELDEEDEAAGASPGLMISADGEGRVGAAGAADDDGELIGGGSSQANLPGDAQQSSATPAAVRDMLDRLYASGSGAPDLLELDPSWSATEHADSEEEEEEE